MHQPERIPHNDQLAHLSEMHHTPGLMPGQVPSTLWSVEDRRCREWRLGEVSEEGGLWLSHRLRVQMMPVM
jgi:hypothetical protein